MVTCATVRKEIQALIQVLGELGDGFDRGYDIPSLPVDDGVQKCILALESLPVRDRLHLQPDWSELIISIQKLEQKAAYVLKQQEKGIQITREAFKMAQAYIESEES